MRRCAGDAMLDGAVHEVEAQPRTSCAFAERVAHAWVSAGSQSRTVTVTAPSGAQVSMRCVNVDSLGECDGADGTSIFFEPLRPLH